MQLCKKILEDIKIIPSYAAYRQNVEQIYKWRLYAAQCTKDEFAITEAIEAGVIGELIEQAEDETELIIYMADWQPWEIHPGQTNRFFIDGREIDWRAIRQARVDEAYRATREEPIDIAKLYEDSNPDLEIYGHARRGFTAFIMHGSEMFGRYGSFGNDPNNNKDGKNRFKYFPGLFGKGPL